MRLGRASRSRRTRWSKRNGRRWRRSRRRARRRRRRGATPSRWNSTGGTTPRAMTRRSRRAEGGGDGADRTRASGRLPTATRPTGVSSRFEATTRRRSRGTTRTRTRRSRPPGARWPSRPFARLWRRATTTRYSLARSRFSRTRSAWRNLEGGRFNAPARSGARRRRRSWTRRWTRTFASGAVRWSAPYAPPSTCRCPRSPRRCV
mmetsp:Transcript_10674/g.43032  ORF Transcript_10674/g.43032 Transcript_10674/m.43032 type:complete len:205 (+) Transcript_10674:1584-2198(+)